MSTQTHIRQYDCPVTGRVETASVKRVHATQKPGGRDHTVKQTPAIFHIVETCTGHPHCGRRIGHGRPPSEDENHCCLAQELADFRPGPSDGVITR